MSDLTLNGLELPVGLDLSGEDEQIGETGRAADGTYWSGVQKVKRRWRFRTTPIAKATAEAWRAYLNCVPLHWSYETADLSSTDGLAIATNPTSLAERSDVHEKFGTYGLLIGEGGAPTWTTHIGSTWTARCWYWDGAALDHYVVWSDGTVYNNGSSVGGGIPAWIGMSSGTLTLTGSGGDVYIDDLVLVPFAVPVAWVTGATGPWSYSGAAVYPTVPPLLNAAGDAMPSGTTSVGARVSGFKCLQMGGVHYQTLDVELREA